MLKFKRQLRAGDCLPCRLKSGGKVVIERYSCPQMKGIWEQQNKLQKWLDVEIAICEGWSELGEIPREAVARIKERATFNLQRVEEIEKETRHDVIAFVKAVTENLGEEGKYIHYGVTSYDVVDTALSLLLKESAELLIADIEALIAIIRKRAAEHKYTLMTGRTHGVHAEPITFGFKLGVWLSEMERNLERMRQAREIVSYGKISGAVGNYANIDPRVERIVCDKLGLKPSPISTQILQRDRHAQYMTTLAVTAGSLEKFATEIRNLQRTEILEVEEMFRKGQRGSSAMPHKRNPWVDEQISGLARVVRANCLPVLESEVTWHERDLANSSIERIVLPDSNILLDYMLRTFTDIVQKLVVYPENMRRNLEKTHGLVFSQRTMLTLVEKGMSREEAYKLVQKNAMQAWETGSSFEELLLNDSGVREYLSADEINSLFDYNYFTKHLDVIFDRLGI
jgi:adenylosuccinate lyase